MPTYVFHTEAAPVGLKTNNSLMFMFGVPNAFPRENEQEQTMAAVFGAKVD